MPSKFLTAFALAAFTAAIVASALAAEDKDKDNDPIVKAMRTVHKAPKTEKKLSEKIIEGTASDEEKQTTLALYKAMADSKPPKGDEAAFKARVAKLIAATQDVVDKKPDAVAHFKSAVNCKACHSEHKPD